MKVLPDSFKIDIVLKNILFIFLLVSFSCKQTDYLSKKEKEHLITELNAKEIPRGDKTIAIIGVSLIDGVKESATNNTSIIISNGKIVEIGKTGELTIPEDAEILNGKGLTLMPGLIDSHYHNSNGYLSKYLKRGITSLRDPGIWIEDYNAERESNEPIPRLFLTGPHLDMAPPTWPSDCYVVRDEMEVREAMDYLIGQGSTAVKIYHRLPLGLIKEVCDIAHENGLPVTGHLEITDARQAILAGLDGIEHVTSLGTALISRREAEVYRQQVLADNNARREGRYKMWKDIDVNGKAADSLISFLKIHQTFLTPTLGAFEYRISEVNQDSVALLGFQNMMKFIGRCQEANIRIVVGSHGPWSKFVEMGWTYQHEMWLLSKSGMDNMRIIKAATIEAARFFRISNRLGTIEKGKQADLILVEGDPIADISAMRNIKKVMLNGNWVN